MSVACGATCSPALHTFDSQALPLEKYMTRERERVGCVGEKGRERERVCDGICRSILVSIKRKYGRRSDDGDLACELGWSMGFASGDSYFPKKRRKCF